MKFIIKILVSAVAVLVTAELLPGVHIDSFLTSLIVALVISLLNVTLKPLLIFFTLPFTVVTFGLFLLVINAAVILVADWFIENSFEVQGFWWALLFSLLLSLINSVFSSIVDTDKKKKKH